MKKTLLFTSMVAMLFAFGCSKEMDNPNAETIPGRGTKVTIGASLEFPEGVSTKSTLNSTTGAFAWTQNSSERIWVQTSNGFQTLSWTSAGANPDLANFTGLITGSLVNDGKGVFPVYYASNGITPLNKPSLSGSDLTITLPSEIAWVSGEANNVMVGVLSAGTVGFQNVGGMFMVTIGNMPSNARKITFTTGKRISGDFAVTTDSNGYYIINTDETNTNGVTFTFTSEQIASEMVFYVPAPIGEYAGLAFQVKDADDQVIASFNGATPKTITRKKLIILPMLSFASVGGNGENGTGNLVIPANYTTEENHGVFLLPSTTSDLEVLIYENSNVTIRYSEGDKPANVALIAQNAIETLNIELPESHVTLNGANTSSNVTINNVEATTSTSTFVVGAGIQIGSGQGNQGLTIKGGSLTLGAPVAGTVKVNIPATNTNTTDEKVNIVINSAITNLEVNTAATQDAPDKVWVSINAGASVTDAIAVPEVNCNLYIAAGASAATVATSATNTTIEGAVGELSASGEGTTVVVEKSGSVTTSIAANDNAAIVIEERTEEEVAAGQAGAIASDRSEDTGGSIDIILSDAVAIIGSTGYNTLQAAINAATSGQTITIVKSFTSAESNQLSVVSNTNDFGAVIEKSLTIDGKGYTITGPASKRPLGIAGNGITVTLKDLTVVNNGSDGPTIWTVGPMTLNLDNTTIDGTHCSGTYNQPITISSNSSLPGRYTLNVTNGSVVKTNDDATAHYAVIVWGPADINVSNSTLKGYAAIYLKPDATGSVVTVSNCDVDSHGYSGISNAFGMFVTESNNNTFTLTSNNYTITAGDQYQVLTEMNGTTGNVVKLLGTSSFTPNDPVHGTLTNSWVKYYVNSLYMDDDNKALFADYISSECSVVKVTEGTYSGLWKVTGPTPEIYYYWDTTSGQQGTYCDLAKPFDNKWLCDGEYIDINKNLALTKTIACQLTSGSFSMNFGEYTVTKGEYSITLKDGVSVVTDKATDIFTAVSASSTIVETVGANTYTYTATPPVAQIGTTTYSTLAEAVAASKDGDTIVLINDCDVTSTINVDHSLTLDLNGKIVTNKTYQTRAFFVYAGAFTIEGNNGKMVTPEECDNYGFVDLKEAAALVVKNTTFEGATHAGAFIKARKFAEVTLTNVNATTMLDGSQEEATANYNSLGVNSIISFNYFGVLNVTGGTYNHNSWKAKVNGAPLGFAFDTENAVASFKDVTINSNVGTIVSAYASDFENCSLTGAETAGTSWASTAIGLAHSVYGTESYSSLGELNRKDNNIKSGTYSGRYAVAIWSTGSQLNISGGTFIGSEASVAVIGDNGNDTDSFEVNISGGSFTGPIYKSGNNRAQITITGGTFSSDPSTYVAAGYKATQTGSVWTVEEDPAAKIGTTNYATLAEAIAAANSTGNVTIELLKDYDFEANEPGYGYTTDWVAEGETTTRYNMLDFSGDYITFDLGNHTISNLFNNTFKVSGTGVVFQNGEMRVGQLYYAHKDTPSKPLTDVNQKTCSYIVYVKEATGFTVNNLTTYGGINVSASTATINNLAFSGTKFYAVCSQSGANVTLNGGTYTKAITGATGNLFWIENGSTMNITGGTYTKGNASFRTGADPVITGGTFDFDPTNFGVDSGYSATDNGNGTWTVQSAIEGTGEGGSGFEPGPSII